MLDDSNSEMATFAGTFATVEPGQYYMCYCSEDAYEVPPRWGLTAYSLTDAFERM